MKKTIIISSLIAIMFANTAQALVVPIPSVDIMFKRVCNSGTSVGCEKRFAMVQTNDKGEFTVSNLADVVYEIYYGNQSMPPIAKVAAVEGKITGKITVDIYDQVVPKPIIKKEVVMPKTVSKIINPTSTPKTENTKVAFVYGVWDVDHLAKLKSLLVKEKVLPEGVTVKNIDDVRVAVKLFQKKYNIDQTGTLGPTTLKKLNSLFIQ